MFCAECGAKNEGTARFCTSCGAKVSAVSGDASTATPSIAKAAVDPLSAFVETTVYEGRVIGKVASGNWVVEGVPNRSGNLQWAKSLVDSMPRSRSSEKTPTLPPKAAEARPHDTSVDETTYKGRVVKKMADGTWMIDGVWSRFERLQLATDYIDGKASEQVTVKVGVATAAVRPSSATQSAVIGGLIVVVGIFALSTLVEKKLPREAVVDEKSRLSDPYWRNVYVDQIRARDEMKRGQNHIIDGLGWEIMKTPWERSFSSRSSDGTRHAVTKKIGSDLFSMDYYDCEKKLVKRDPLMKTEGGEKWEEVLPGTVGGNLLVHVCALP